MTNRTAATRYARALLDVALAEKVDPVQVEQELAAFVDLFAQDETLRKVLLNPAVPAPRKRAAVAEIAKQSGTATVVRKLLVLLAERDRLVILPDLLAGYRDRLMDHQRVVRAEVTSAVELAPERAQTIQRRLAEVTGRTVNLTTRVDPGLVGGMVARIGSVVYDGSVTTQLRKLRTKLAEGL
ncbi:MAG: ATP synthase F1 subunit delta [Vicinamibacterales bacterium]